MHLFLSCIILSNCNQFICYRACAILPFSRTYLFPYRLKDAPKASSVNTKSKNLSTFHEFARSTNDAWDIDDERMMICLVLNSPHLHLSNHGPCLKHPSSKSSKPQKKTQSHCPTHWTGSNPSAQTRSRSTGYRKWSSQWQGGKVQQWRPAEC